MAEQSFLNTLSKIAGNFNPNIARAHQEEARLALEHAKFERAGENADYAKTLKTFEIYETMKDEIRTSVVNRQTDPDHGNAAIDALTAKQNELSQRLNIAPRDFSSSVQPDPLEGRTDAETRDIRIVETEEAIRRAQEEGDGLSLAQRSAELEALQSARNKASERTPRTQIVDVGGNQTLINLDTGDPIADYGSKVTTPKAGEFKYSYMQLPGEDPVRFDSTPAGIAEKRAFGEKNPTAFPLTNAQAAKVLSGRQNSGIAIYDENGNRIVQLGGDPLTSTVRSYVQKDIIDLQERRVQLEALTKRFKPEYLQWGTKIWNAGLSFVDKLGVLPESQKKEYRESKQFVRSAISQMNEYIRAMTGAAMGEAEATRLRKAIADAEKDGPTAFQAKLEDTLAEVKLAELRAFKRLHGLSQVNKITDADTLAPGMSLPEIKEELNRAAKLKEQELIELLGERPAGKDAAEFRADVFRSVLTETFKVPADEVHRYVR
jgi:hypothetical protein